MAVKTERERERESIIVFSEWSSRNCLWCYINLIIIVNIIIRISDGDVTIVDGHAVSQVMCVCCV